MANFKSPARVRFPRSSVTGTRPDVLAPGSFAVNWADKAVWVGDQRGDAMRFNRKIELWDAALSYFPDDIVIQSGDMWAALVNVFPGPFDPTKWRRLTDAGRASIGEPYATSSLEGGLVTLIGPSAVSVTAGRGVVVDNSNPEAVGYTVVSWSPVPTIDVTYAGEPWSVLAVDESGTFVNVALSLFDPEARRNLVLIAYALWNTGTQEISQVFDARYFGGGAAQDFRDKYRADGGAYRIEGVIAEPSAALTIRVTEGQVFALQFNRASDPQNPSVIDLAEDDPISFVPITTTSAEAGPSTSDVDPDQYDLNGVLTPVAPGEATIQYLYSLPDGSQRWLQYGQTIYPSLSTALASLQSDWRTATETLYVEPVMLLCALAVVGGATDLTATAQARFVIANRGSDPFVSASEVDDAPYFYVDGSRPMTGTLDMANNAIDNSDINGGDF